MLLHGLLRKTRTVDSLRAAGRLSVRLVAVPMLHVGVQRFQDRRRPRRRARSGCHAARSSCVDSTSGLWGADDWCGVPVIGQAFTSVVGASRASRAREMDRSKSATRKWATHRCGVRSRPPRLAAALNLHCSARGRAGCIAGRCAGLVGTPGGAAAAGLPYGLLLAQRPRPCITFASLLPPVTWVTKCRVGDLRTDARRIVHTDNELRSHAGLRCAERLRNEEEGSAPGRRGGRGGRRLHHQGQRGVRQALRGAAARSLPLSRRAQPLRRRPPPPAAAACRRRPRHPPTKRPLCSTTSGARSFTGCRRSTPTSPQSSRAGSSGTPPTGRRRAPAAAGGRMRGAAPATTTTKASARPRTTTTTRTCPTTPTRCGQSRGQRGRARREQRSGRGEGQDFPPAAARPAGCRLVPPPNPLPPFPDRPAARCCRRS
jgi:hypothetical protein